ncbi:hypothetical protein BR93DRAFT_162127 [Coniochaeta sp. PMI_546]|nr:hypothetical protein BR93DRAFT_162127 [Coniochaeta sp. PMI_546]
MKVQPSSPSLFRIHTSGLLSGSTILVLHVLCLFQPHHPCLDILPPDLPSLLLLDSSLIFLLSPSNNNPALDSHRLLPNIPSVRHALPVNRRRNNENHLLARAPVLSHLHRVGVEHSPGQKASRGQLDGVIRPRAAEDQVEIPRHLEEVLEIGHRVGEVDAVVRDPQLNEEEVEDLHGEVVDLLRLAGWDEGEEVVDLLCAQAVVLCYVGRVGHGRCGGVLVHRVWIGGTDVGIPLMPSNCLIFFLPQKPAQKSE